MSIAFVIWYVYDSSCFTQVHKENATENNKDTEIINKITKSERIKTELKLQCPKNKITISITKKWNYNYTALQSHATSLILTEADIILYGIQMPLF